MIGNMIARGHGVHPRDRRRRVSGGYVPGYGTPGGVRSGAVAFSSGLSGFAGATAAYSISPNAVVDPRFSSGEPGIYVVRMIAESVRLNQANVSLHDVKPWNDAMRAQGLDAQVTAVRYVENRNARSSNWAGELLDDVFGSGASGDYGIVDMVFDVTVQVHGQSSDDLSPASPSESDAAGMDGLGAVQIGAGAVFAVIAVIAVVLAVTFPGFGKLVLDGVKYVGKVGGAAVGGAAGAIAENAGSILVVAAVAAAAIFLLKKGGARYASKSGRFSF